MLTLTLKKVLGYLVGLIQSHLRNQNHIVNINLVQIIQMTNVR
uniref:Uncharacterized protein n=1 Tax=Dulem virus 42 TaxID=3145760 RepID=A0AAU8B926_9CAUD